MDRGLARPIVSVVIPTYNNVEHIDETVRSVLAQTFSDFEVLISDHSSTDGTWEALQAYADHPKVRLIRIPRAAGPEENWDNATSGARGAFLKLVCGDDLLHPDCLERQVAAMESGDGIVMVAARRDIVTSRGDVLVRGRGLPGLAGRVSGGAAIRRSVRAGTNIFGEPGCVLIRREVLDRVGGWDGTYPYVIDQYTYSKALLHGDLYAIPEPLASFRVSAGQWSYALARSQYRQVVELHRALQRDGSGHVKTRDRVIGGAGAAALTAARRLTYVYLFRRVREPRRPESEADVHPVQVTPLTVD